MATHLPQTKNLKGILRKLHIVDPYTGKTPKVRTAYIHGGYERAKSYCYLTRREITALQPLVHSLLIDEVHSIDGRHFTVVKG